MSTNSDRSWMYKMIDRYCDIMNYVRDEAKKEAEEANVEVGTNFALLKPFKPVWINQEYWDKMIDKWNTPQWKNKSKKNKKNKNTLVNGVIAKHTVGSIKMSVTRKKMEKELGRPPTYVELYIECHTKKAKKRSNSGPGEFITSTAKEDLEKYKEYMIEKFGPDVSTHPLGDLEAWERVVGAVKKGRLKGAPSDPGFIVTCPNSCAEKVERLNAKIASLLEERIQEKEEAATARMTAIEQMLAKIAPSTLADV